MKSIIFVLLMHSHSGGHTALVGAFESLTQCRQAQATASQNEAADYTCDSVPVAGEWSRKASRFLPERDLSLITASDH
jgi:hypothetical protein